MRKVFEDHAELIPMIKGSGFAAEEKRDKDPLKNHCKRVFKHFKIVFVPLFFWSSASERNLVKLI
jgi:hypothetical protein